MFQTVLVKSFTMSFVILLIFIISPLTNKRYGTKWRYYLWLVLAINLIIPVRFNLPNAPFTITPRINPETPFSFPQNRVNTNVEINRFY